MIIVESNVFVSFLLRFFFKHISENKEGKKKAIAINKTAKEESTNIIVI